MTARARGLLAASAVLAFAGCAVGPDFHPPAKPTQTGYLPAGADVATTDAAPGALGAAQRLTPGADIAGDWWALFRSPALDALVRRALAHNPQLPAAQAALRAAHENTAAQIGSYYPQVGAGLTVSRNLTPLASLSPVGATNNPYYSLTTASVSVSFLPDVFGLNQRTVEGLAATADTQRWQVEATYLTLTSNVVAAAFTEASLAAQIEETEEIVGIGQKLTSILRQEFALGQIAQADVRTQEAALALAQQSLGPLQKQRAQARDQLAALVGATPDQSLPSFALTDFTLPTELPLSLPADLVAQRPDLQAALANLHAASAQIGVAIAQRLPQFPLSAQGGREPNNIADLFEPHTAFWSLIGSATLPIFQGGTLLHRQRAAQAGFDQAAAQYDQAVLAALQNVADTLAALHIDATTLGSAQAAQSAAEDSLRIARGQLALGSVSTLVLLNAQDAALTARLATVQAQAARLSDTAALFQALGGGWWHRHDIPAPPSKAPF